MASGWDNLWVAVSSAAAALTGLLFVAVSINLARIMAFPTLPGRAAEALIVMFSALVSALFGLMPQGHMSLGIEWAATGALVIAIATTIQVRSRQKRSSEERPLFRVLSAQGVAVVYVVGGGFAIAGSHDAPYWIVAGCIVALMAGVFDAWVLLVEILR